MCSWREHIELQPRGDSAPLEQRDWDNPYVCFIMKHIIGYFSYTFSNRNSPSGIPNRTRTVSNSRPMRLFSFIYLP